MSVLNLEGGYADKLALTSHDLVAHSRLKSRLMSAKADSKEIQLEIVFFHEMELDICK